MYVCNKFIVNLLMSTCTQVFLVLVTFLVPCEASLFFFFFAAFPSSFGPPGRQRRKQQYRLLQSTQQVGRGPSSVSLPSLFVSSFVCMGRRRRGRRQFVPAFHAILFLGQSSYDEILGQPFRVGSGRQRQGLYQRRTGQLLPGLSCGFAFGPPSIEQTIGCVGRVALQQCRSNGPVGSPRRWCPCRWCQQWTPWLKQHCCNVARILGMLPVGSFQDGAWFDQTGV